MQHEPIGRGPSCISGAVADLLALLDELGERRRLPPERIEQGEFRPEERLSKNPRAWFMFVTPREGVGGRVLLPGLVLHLKTITK